MRIRILGSAALAAALVPLVGVTASAPAAAATGDGHVRYVALAGNDNFLIYASKVGTHPLDPASLSRRADLYALGKTGRPIHLGRALTSAKVVSLSRSNLVVVNPFRHHNRLRAWDLRSDRRVNVGTNQDIVGATPDGWLALDKGFPDGTHVLARSYSGDLVDYGTPITTGVDYGITVGPHGFVAYANNFQNDNGEVTYTSWGNPTRHRTLVEPGGKNVRCDSVSATYAACIVGAGTNRSVALFALRGKDRTISGNRCAHQLAVWGSSVAWSIGTAKHGCGSGHIGATTIGGASDLSKRRFNILGMTTAFDRLVTSNKGQRSLVTLRGIRADAKRLTRADVS